MKSGRSHKKLDEIQAMRDLCFAKQQELAVNPPLTDREGLRVILLGNNVRLLDWVLGFETLEYE